MPAFCRVGDGADRVALGTERRVAGFQGFRVDANIPDLAAEPGLGTACAADP